MEILIIGNGGREHAFAWKCSQSKKVTQIYVAPGNGGTAKEEKVKNINIDAEDIENLLAFAKEKNIALTIVGPEAPLVLGIVDKFNAAGLRCFGPNAKAAQLEGSKSFTKDFLLRHNIPTAEYACFSELNLAIDYIKSRGAPIVVKADGLAAGKGVLIINELKKAKEELELMLLKSKFGNASEKVVVEEFLDGIELSVFVITNGSSYKILPSAKDYKRIGEGDTGLNTGGMGAVSPVPFIDRFFMEKIEQEIIKPSIDYLIKKKCKKLILGCTELPIAIFAFKSFKNIKTSKIFLDPNLILAHAAMRKYKR